MLIRVNGGAGGFADYMERGHKQGRLEDRDELDNRVVLHGDLVEFESIVQGIEGNQEKYLHITLGFAEHNIAQDTLRNITQDFVQFATTGYRDTNEIYIYAEAHLPRIKQGIDYRTGEVYDRLAHIHIAIPLRNLATGTREEIFGLHDQRVKWLDAFQEYTNQTYGLKSPKESMRVHGHQGDALARYKGDQFPGGEDAKAVKAWLATLAKTAQSYADFQAQISAHGELRRRYEGTPREYLWFKPDGAKQGINLREQMFRESYFLTEAGQRPVPTDADEKTYLDEPARGGGLPQTGYQKLMEEWRDYGALELRFAGAKGRRERYGITDDMAPAEKLAILKTREAKFYTKHAARFAELENGHERGIQPAGRAGRVNVRGRRGHDDDRDRSSRDFADSDGAAGRALASGRADRRGDGSGPIVGPLPDLRSSRPRDGRSDAADAVLSGDVPRHQGDDQQVHGLAGRGNDAQGSGSRLSGLASKLKATVDIEAAAAEFEGDSSELGQAGKECVERIRQREALPRITEIRDSLEPARLLAHLAETHRLDTRLYQVEGQKIVAGRRSLTVNDFLAKEMHLAWPQAETILRQTWQAQQDREPYRPPEQAQVTDRQLWDSFKGWKGEQIEAGKAERKAIYDQQTRELAELKAGYKAEKQRIIDSHGRGREAAARRNAELSMLRMLQLLNEREIRQRAAEIRDASFQRDLSFRGFLVERSDAGDLVAFERLRRMAPEAAEQIKGNRATGKQHLKVEDLAADDKRLVEVLLPAEALAKKGMHRQVDRDGNVSYYRGATLLLVDQRNAVTSLHEDTNTLQLQLEFAVCKFGYQNLRLDGTDSFKRRIVELAAKRKEFAHLAFDDKALQAQLEAARKAMQKKPVAQESNKPAPAPAPRAQQASQEAKPVPKPANKPSSGPKR